MRVNPILFSPSCSVFQLWTTNYTTSARMNKFTLAALLILAMTLQLSLADVFLWPQPRSIVWGIGTAIPLAPSFYFSVPHEVPELQLAAARFRRLIFKERWVPVQVPVGSKVEEMSGSVEELAVMRVKVKDLGADLQQGVDESYSIVVPDGGGEGMVEASTIWGVLHALETFSQLVRARGEGKQLLLEHGVNVQDAPLFEYRGLTLDTARNFYPVRDLRRTIRALAHNKLNVLHWHLTDSQSFPLSLPSEPELALNGSYGPDFVYSASDVHNLVAYARSYGVRVVPEIDMPGHSASWGAAHPDIVTCREKFWDIPGGPIYALEPTPGQLDPLNPDTYRVVKNVIHDVALAFPDKLFHSGSDELVPDCWMDNADIQSYTSHGGTLGDLLEKFISTTHPYITAHNKTVVYWEDVLLSATINVSSNILPLETTILETWNNGPINTKRITGAGYRTIVASSDFYYLDCGRGDFVGNDSSVDVPVDPTPGKPSINYGGNGGDWCAPYKSWQRIYDYDITFNLTISEAALVLGGEVSLWSEQSDATVLDGLVWPRASALAESLWSGNKAADGQKRFAEAINRLNDWRYRLVARGIAAAPLQPLWCLKHPGQCNAA